MHRIPTLVGYRNKWQCIRICYCRATQLKTSSTNAVEKDLTAEKIMEMRVIDVVLEVDGLETPILCQIDTSSMDELRNSLTNVLCISKPMEGKVVYWDRGRR